jgi:hypothetical protein
MTPKSLVLLGQRQKLIAGLLGRTQPPPARINGGPAKPSETLLSTEDRSSLRSSLLLSTGIFNQIKLTQLFYYAMCGLNRNLANSGNLGHGSGSVDQENNIE